MVGFFLHDVTFRMCQKAAALRSRALLLLLLLLRAASSSSGWFVAVSPTHAHPNDSLKSLMTSWIYRRMDELVRTRELPLSCRTVSDYS